MSTRNFGKKLYIRVDASGNAIAGSSVWRKKKPTAGRWKEVVEPNLCCNNVTPPVVLVVAGVDTALGGYRFDLLCDLNVVLTKEVIQVITTIGEYADSLNTNLSSIGTFEATGADEITLTLNGDLAADLCPGGTLTYELTTIA